MIRKRKENKVYREIELADSNINNHVILIIRTNWWENFLLWKKLPKRFFEIFALWKRRHFIVQGFEALKILNKIGTTWTKMTFRISWRLTVRIKKRKQGDHNKIKGFDIFRGKKKILQNGFLG